MEEPRPPRKPPQIDPANTWVTSDTHWGHTNIVEYCRRPPDHEEAMVAEWFSAVPEDATVLHLGDLSYRNNGMFQHVISKKLTGARKLLIKGNHDHSRPVFYRKSGFQVVRPFSMVYDPSPEFGCDSSKRWIISFSHYPLKTPEPMLKGKDGTMRKHIHIHGHIHNNGYGGYTTDFTPFSLGQINVSVEQLHYRPVNLDRLLKGYIQGCYEPEEKVVRASEAAELGTLDPVTGKVLEAVGG